MLIYTSSPLAPLHPNQFKKRPAMAVLPRSTVGVRRGELLSPKQGIFYQPWHEGIADRTSLKLINSK